MKWGDVVCEVLTLEDAEETMPTPSDSALQVGTLWLGSVVFVSLALVLPQFTRYITLYRALQIW